MKKAGVGLILAGLVLILLYASYKVITIPEMHMVPRLGIIGLMAGFFMLVLGLVVEKKKDREADDDDISKY